MSSSTSSSGHLKKVLGPLQLWGIAVGLVISGEYFGWSYGWNTAGTLGFLVATLLVATMYTTFIFSFTELSTAIPHAGGPFAYARRAFGPTGGFVAGFATLIEFVFAPPAIALAIGAYLNVQFPGINPKWFALGAYVVFIALNWIGIGIAAAFELFVTVLAIFELLVFIGVVAPGWTLASFAADGWAGGSVLNGTAIAGIFASIPFAIWFFLAIEGAAMAAEEAREPHRTIPIAYTTGILTLVVLAFGVMILAGGVGDWRQLANINDPLPQAMKAVVGEHSGWLHMLVWIGLFGLVASFHGIIMGCSRQIFALARAGYLPRYFAGLSPRFDTPHRALLASGAVGVIAIFSDEWVQFGGQTLTANIVTMAVLGAIVMYLVSMAALFRLRRSEPGQIEELIASLGKASPGYNPAKPPYAVFDWDNTSVFLDIEEAALIYQLENLVFGATPAQLDVALRKNIPRKNFLPAHNNAAGQPLNIDLVAPDIVESYTWLYRNYSGLKGSQPLAVVKLSPHYAAFTTKVRYLYEAIGDTFDHDTAYPWVTYLFAGMTEAQVRKLTAETVAWQLKQPVAKVKWISPAALPGRAGVVSVSWKNGLRLQPEMQALYAAFRDAGFDVWVCSASFVDVIKEISSNPAFGYNNPPERVLAMELERDAGGVIQPEFRRGYDQTQGPGKTRSIRRFLVSKYGYGPSFVAGDSEGDQNMMADFADTKKVLIVNRLRDPKTDIGKFSAIAVSNYGKADTRYLLQGRDDNTGAWVPSQLHTPLGAAQGKALK